MSTVLFRTNELPNAAPPRTAPGTPSKFADPFTFGAPAHLGGLVRLSFFNSNDPRKHRSTAHIGRSVSITSIRGDS